MDEHMVRGVYFDGQVATAHDVRLRISDARVVVDSTDVWRDDPLGSVVISERMGKTPRFVWFSDGALCEVAEVAALERMLSASGLGEDRLSRWERSRGLAAVLAAFLLVSGAVTYQVVLPWLARTAASNLPLSALGTVSAQALSILDAGLFRPSRLPVERQARLGRQFAQFVRPLEPDVPMRLVFRDSPSLGANALALPSGTIVVTDDLVELAYNDLEIMAVLAHEAGHVQARHGMQNLIQSSILSILVTWYVGDISGLAAAAPTALLEAKYSRDLERDADYYAASVLYTNGITVGFLIDILRRLDEAHGGSPAGAGSYLSSHPTTTERLDELELYTEPY